MALDVVLTIFTRWVGLLGLAALAGGVVMAALVVPPGLPRVAVRLSAWNRVAVGLLLVTGAGELVLRARAMTGGGLATAVRAAPLVLARTHFGTVWAVRTGALAALLALAGRSGRAARTAACALALGIALATSLVGHAADRGDLSLPVLVDWTHVVAATTWTGGLFCLSGLVLPEATRWPRDRLVVLVRRFSTLAGASLGVVVASGVYNACLQVGSLHALATTPYGRILVAKISLVAAMVCFGAINRFVVFPRLDDPTVTRPATARLARYVAWEAALALAVFACTAILTESTPARHAAHARVEG